MAKSRLSFPRSCDITNQIPAFLPEGVNSSYSTRLSQFTKGDDNDTKAYREFHSSVSVTTVKSAADRNPYFGDKGSGEVPELDKSISKKKHHSASQSLSLSSTFGMLSESAQPVNKSVNGTDDMNSSDCLMSAQNCTGMSHKRKKSGKDDVIYKSSSRKRPRRQLHLDFQSPADEQDVSAVAACDGSNKWSEESVVLTTLFGCDNESLVETQDCAALDRAEKLNSDILQHLGSSGVESESSSNDVDLMIARKFLLNRKCSSGFQSLGHISETECCPSPVFPTVSNEPVADTLKQYDHRTASESVSASPVFGKRKSQSFAGESPCLSLSGSSRKRTPVPGCAESFSPDVSQCSIAHLMTSPLLDVSETLTKTSRSRSSTRRCLDQQMYQSGIHPSLCQHSSSNLTDEDI